MRLSEAKRLKIDQTIFSNIYRNTDGSPQRFVVNGAVKLWKRDKNRFQVPLKRGLWQHCYLTRCNYRNFSISEERALKRLDKADMRLLGFGSFAPRLFRVRGRGW